MTSLYQLECADDLRSLVCAEYREMPGLSLTLPQAVRLWAAEPALCVRVLETLVESGVLCRVGGRYVRADAGRLCA